MFEKMTDVKRFLDRGGAGSKILGAGRGNSQTRYILTRGGAFLKNFGAGAHQGSHFPRGWCGAVRGVHPWWGWYGEDDVASDGGGDVGDVGDVINGGGGDDDVDLERWWLSGWW